MKRKTVVVKKKPASRAAAAKVVRTGGKLRQRARNVVRTGRGK